jgi:twinkle protein
MTSADEIKAMLNGRAEDVCRMLFPEGRMMAGEFCVGGLSGERGQSLRVNPAKDGVWCDFATGEKGDNVLELWRAARGLSFAAALKEAADWLDVRLEPLEALRPAPRVETVRRKRPELEAVKPATGDRKLREDSPVWKYLTGDRGISGDVLRRYTIAECEGKHGAAYVLPYRDDAGKVEMVKRMALARPDGKKQMTTDGGKVLFGKKQATECGLDFVIVCEGEIDAMSWAMIDAPAVSVPYGASNHHWLENDLEWLDRFEKVFISFDADEAGDKGAAELVLRIGRERCWLVTMPDGCKDANDAIVSGRAAELEIALAEAKRQLPPELRDWSEFAMDAIDYMAGKTDPGIPVFFSPDFRIRESEMTIWTGFSGHGKTIILSQVIGDLCDAGHKCCIASFEQQPRKTLGDILRQRTRKASPNMDDLANGIKWKEGTLWFYDHVGSRKWEEVLETFRFAFRALGVTQFVIDSLLKCGISGDDFNRQKQMVDAICEFCNAFPVHVHLVAHARKREDETKIPMKLDVKGSGDITDLAWNGITVWRNKEKEAKAIERGRDDPEVRKMPDARVFVWKQRETGEEPTASLAFDHACKRFRIK